MSIPLISMNLKG